MATMCLMRVAGLESPVRGRGDEGLGEDSFDALLLNLELSRGGGGNGISGGSCWVGGGGGGGGTLMMENGRGVVATEEEEDAPGVGEISVGRAGETSTFSSA